MTEIIKSTFIMIAMMIFKTDDECDACIYGSVTTTGFELTTNQFVNEEHSTIQPNWSNEMNELCCEYFSVWCIQLYIIIMSRTSQAISSKWQSVCLRTKWLWIPVPLLSLKLQIWRLLRERSVLTFRQIILCILIYKHLAKSLSMHLLKS